jgi:hypothetical protein
MFKTNYNGNKWNNNLNNIFNTENHLQQTLHVSSQFKQLPQIVHSYSLHIGHID